MKRLAVLIIPLLLLAACSQPRTMTPNITQDELSAEQNEQQRMTDEIKRQGGLPKNWKTLHGTKKQFEAVGERIESAGAVVCRHIGFDPERGCYFAFEMDTRDESVNAHADGKKIVVAGGMMRFVKSDNELAMVMAHEMAHNLLGHVESNRRNSMGGMLFGLVLDVAAATQGVNTQGGFGELGGNVGLLSYSSAFESEADYVGMYIMANAGYDIHNVAHMWRRMSIANSDAIYVSTTHPSNSERFVMLNKTVTEIEYKQKHHFPLLPDFKPQT